MTPQLEPVPKPAAEAEPGAVDAAPTSAARVWRRAGLVLAVAAAGAASGQLLAAGLALLAGVPGWQGAAIGAVVALLALPAAAWLLPVRWFAPAIAASAEPASVVQRPLRDPLTGAFTQMHFVAAADREWARLRRRGEDAALLMIDIDRLGRVNEVYGRAFGDALTCELTRQVASTLRPYDLLTRFSGAVLVVYLPHTDPLGALDVAERIRERVAAIRLSQDGKTVTTTVSIGVAPIGEAHGGLDAVIADAGAALRDAKAAGRNCVRSAPIPPRRSPQAGLAAGDRRRA